ncbi:hypothetical protein OS493_017209 [Desmophyllum pertusum]|uniref:Uncharacterized protein n=1 Tax=Desmophyllum pertusum TaxID=174260 RepID=A0A9W9YCE7_9CNID|nr:hypothetical protein OS493_017209 [Desmophyllum pertusum]
MVRRKSLDYVQKEALFENTRRAVENYDLIRELEFSKPASGGKLDKGAIQRAKEALKNTFKADIEKFPRLSKVGKVFTKASKWLKGASIFEVLGPITDVLTIGLNIWGLEIAIRDNNPAGIAAASLSIAAGVVGLTTFIAAIVTGTAVLGPIGAIVGAILGIAASLVELFLSSSGYDEEAVKAYNERLGKLGNILFLFENGDVQTDSKSSFYGRKFVGPGPLGISEAQEEVEDLQYVCIGYYNFIQSPIKPLEPPFSGLGKELGWVGFDFYGKFKTGTEYGGVHVFVDSDMISESGLTGVDIDTAKHYSGGSDSSEQQNDVISIGDYKDLNIMRNTKPPERDSIKVKTRNGHDSLNINGMIGKFESSYENKLTADLGEGGNVLSFQGITKDRSDIKGVFFDPKTAVVKYYHGQNKNTHSLGTVRNVGLFSGSPFDDHVILYSADFTVVQIRGRNVYEFNCNDLAADSSEPRQFKIVDKSTSSPKLNLKTTSALEIAANDTVESFDTTGQSPSLIFEVLVETATTANLFINNAGSRPINQEHINPVLINGENKKIIYGTGQRVVNYEDGDKSDLLFLKWPTQQTEESRTYEVNMKEGTDYVVVSDKYLLDPSGIDGESLRFTIRSGFTSSEPNPDKPGTFKKPIMINIDKPGDLSYGFAAHVLNAEKIINEYGDELVDIPSFLYDSSGVLSLDLYDRYMEVTSETLNIKTEEDVLE